MNMIDTLFENPFFNICFLVGLIFIIAGFVMFKFPPKNINYLYGYRTVSSMKSQERWEFAQKFSSIEMMKFGALLVVASLLGIVTNFGESTNLILGLFLVILTVVLLFLRVEKAIKNKFD